MRGSDIQYVEFVRAFNYQIQHLEYNAVYSCCPVEDGIKLTKSQS